jgi:hypothetical protein
VCISQIHTYKGYAQERLNAYRTELLGGGL